MSQPRPPSPVCGQRPRFGLRTLSRRLGGGVTGAVLAAGMAAGQLASCSSSSGSSAAPARGRLSVVAAENFWGSLAAQLGGDRVRVTSIITKPDTDPHAYEPTPGDGRAVASARYVIYNGIGYDPWAPKVLDANPRSGRAVLNVGDLVGIKPGGNPHRWYSPTEIGRAS